MQQRVESHTHIAQSCIVGAKLLRTNYSTSVVEQRDWHSARTRTEQHSSYKYWTDALLLIHIILCNKVLSLCYSSKLICHIRENSEQNLSRTMSRTLSIIWMWSTTSLLVVGPSCWIGIPFTYWIFLTALALAQRCLVRLSLVNAFQSYYLVYLGF